MDQRLVVAIAESPMRDDVLEAGECDRGFLDFVVPGHASPAGVRYAYGGQFEEARWEIAQ
jgi:hypothetical protein